MKFGWLTLAHSPSPGHDAQAIFEQLEQATLAEELGFAGVWLTEHNFTGESVYADPIPFAAALAMRTARIRIGFAVIQMALRHPVRLATQLSLLDNLTGGRVDIGVGRRHDARVDRNPTRSQRQVFLGAPAGAAPGARAASASPDLAQRRFTR